ncbi:uncharacterized protein [Dermacentor albipictus]|uniref:uncharacterized protein n=1 Tax=Dermacentor albipictus TaxID=60249 RepID=UPI0038FCE687
MEREVQTRLTRFVEQNELWPHEIIGFRLGLCMQDVMLLLKHDITDSRSTEAKVILGHVKDSLSDRTACMKFQDIESPTLKFGSRGTPQGSVLSPFLFNVTMRGLPEVLRSIQGLNFSMYADDITLWTNQGSDASIEERLQAAADSVVDYAASS